MTRLMLIINPAAGRGGFRNGLGDALNLLDKGGCRTTLFFTSGRGDATEFAAKYGADFDIVGCVGGDGTLSEVLAGLMRLENPPKVGYIPMGTANDVATTLGLPKNDTVSAARRILNGEPHPFDVGGFGYDKYFAYIAAFGAFTEVSYAMPQSQKKLLGHLAYVLQGMAALPKLESYNTRRRVRRWRIRGAARVRQHVEFNFGRGHSPPARGDGLPRRRRVRAGAGEGSGQRGRLRRDRGQRAEPAL